MDPSSKRKARLVVALGVALMLSVALVYTSFGASTEAMKPSELADAVPGKAYKMSGRVVKGSIQRDGETMRFRVADRDDPSAVIEATYSGTVPDPFRGGREIVLTGSVERGVFVGETDTLITKCPSKFSADKRPPNDS